jgi:phosphoserine phosphatase
MGGSVPFEEALAARLSLFKPSLSKVEEYLDKRPPSSTPPSSIPSPHLKIIIM